MFLALDCYELEEKKKEIAIAELKDNCKFFKENGFEVGAWIWTFRIKGNGRFKNMRFCVDEQLPFKLPAGTKIVGQLAPTKSNDRVLPITEETLPYFVRQFDLIEKQRK